MNDSQQSDYSCTHCHASVTQQDTFCPNCGSLFSDGLRCSNHKSAEAAGVCVICSKPYCEKCGKETNAIFLCDPHWQYEILEGMARVFGTIDNVQAQYVTSCLEQAGYHPFLYSRRFNPGSGMINTWAKAGIRNFGKHPIVELKVLVPFSEVLKSEKTLHELGIREG
jgi:hypothetical protein